MTPAAGNTTLITTVPSNSDRETVFAEPERSMIRSRVMAGLDRVREQGKKLGRPSVGRKVEEAIRQQLDAGHGILKVAAMVGVGSGTVQRVKKEMMVVR